MKKLLHIIGFHDPLTCIETGEEKNEYQSAFDLFITKYTQYQCGCGRKFWMPRGSFNEWKIQVTIEKMTLETVSVLLKRGDYDGAIDLLK